MKPRVSSQYIPIFCPSFVQPPPPILQFLLFSSPLEIATADLPSYLLQLSSGREHLSSILEISTPLLLLHPMSTAIAAFVRRISGSSPLNTQPLCFTRLFSIFLAYLHCILVPSSKLCNSSSIFSLFLTL